MMTAVPAARHTSSSTVTALKRGGSIREVVEDVDELYARLTPQLADALFDDDAGPLIEWMGFDEDDWDAYQNN